MLAAGFDTRRISDRSAMIWNSIDTFLSDHVRQVRYIILYFAIHRQNYNKKGECPRTADAKISEYP